MVRSSMRVDCALERLVHRHPDHRRAVVVAPADVRRRLAAAHHPLVGVDPLVGDDADLARVVEDPRDELAADLGELVLGAGLVEGVLVALEERDVGVHAGARLVGERLGHERRPDVLAERDLPDDGAEGHDVVGGRQRVGVAQVDLLLARAALVVAELHRDAHRLEHRDRLAAEVGAVGVRGVVEVAAAVDRHRLDAGLRVVLEQVELDLGVRVEGEALLRGLAEGALEHVAGIGERRASRRASRCRRTCARSTAPRRATGGSGTSPGRAWPACRTRRPARSPRSPSRRTRCPRRRRPRARPAPPRPTSGSRARR